MGVLMFNEQLTSIKIKLNIVMYAKIFIITVFP